MTDKNLEKAGRLITCGLHALVNPTDNADDQEFAELAGLSELAQPGTCLWVRQYEMNYPIEAQVKVDEYAEVGDEQITYYEIYRHDEKRKSSVQTTEKKMPKTIQNYLAMQNFILARKDMRCNMVTGAVEWADRGTQDFVRIDRQQMTTMWTLLQEAGIPTDFNALNRFCTADRYPHYDPLLAFMNALPEWDGHDHAGDFIRRLTTDEHCIEGMRLWLRAIVAKMLHFHSEEPWANMLMPLLVGAQGLKKTTFARSILPFDGFFAQNIDFSPKGDWMRKLTSYIVVCDDEFDKHGDSQLATIKNALSTSEVMIKEPYAKRETPHVRLAAMIGTSNRLDLLRDETGSRRFLVINVDHCVDLDTPIPYEQIYAQLKTELLAGEPYYPQKDFEQRNEEHNLDYRVGNIVEEIFCEHYRIAPAGTPGAQWVPANTIYETLCTAHPQMKREKRTLKEFGKTLRAFVQHHATQNNLNPRLLFTRRNGLSQYSVQVVEK